MQIALRQQVQTPNYVEKKANMNFKGFEEIVLNSTNLDTLAKSRKEAIEKAKKKANEAGVDKMVCCEYFNCVNNIFVIATNEDAEEKNIKEICRKHTLFGKGTPSNWLTIK